MYGAVLGDIAGSRYEFSKPKGFKYKDVALFDNLCRYTDDTVLTVATKYAIIRNIPYGKAYRSFAKRYPRAGYGNMFRRWTMNHGAGPYGSFGNGAAMRVSFVGEFFKTLEDVEIQAEKSAVCTHNHPDGVMGARAIAAAVFLARSGESKSQIAKYLKDRCGYNCKKPVALYRPFSKFDATAAGSVPLAIRCFLESDNWESCIRKVLSVNCDTDTVACMSGAIAEAFYKTTGQDNDALIKKYLLRPDESGKFDSFLCDWLMKEYVPG